MCPEKYLDLVMKKEQEDAENYLIRGVIICNLHAISSQMIRLLGHVKHVVEIRNTYILVVKPQRKTQV
jgi:ribosomal 30S subunit maturation factor RimM